LGKHFWYDSLCYQPFDEKKMLSDVLCHFEKQFEKAPFGISLSFDEVKMNHQDGFVLYPISSGLIFMGCTFRHNIVLNVSFRSDAQLNSLLNAVSMGVEEDFV
jgi:hypothetical protein